VAGLTLARRCGGNHWGQRRRGVARCVVRHQAAGDQIGLIFAHNAARVWGVTTIEIAPGQADAWVSTIKDRLAAGDRVRVTFETPALSPAEMAEEIGVSRATIQRRITAGDIRTQMRGNRHRIPLAEVERFRHTYVREMADVLATDF